MEGLLSIDFLRVLGSELDLGIVMVDDDGVDGLILIPGLVGVADDDGVDDGGTTSPRREGNGNTGNCSIDTRVVFEDTSGLSRLRFLRVKLASGLLLIIP